MTIRDIRKSREITMSQMAQLLGVSTGYISLMETGQRKPSLEVAIRMADILGVPPDEIVAEAARMASAMGKPAHSWIEHVPIKGAILAKAIKLEFTEHPLKTNESEADIEDRLLNLLIQNFGHSVIKEFQENREFIDSLIDKLKTDEKENR